MYLLEIDTKYIYKNVFLLEGNYLVFWLFMQFDIILLLIITSLRGLGGEKRESNTQMGLKFKWAWLIMSSLLLYADPVYMVFTLMWLI